MHWLLHLLAVDLTIYTLKKQSDNTSAGIIVKPTQTTETILESFIYTVERSLGVTMRCITVFQISYLRLEKVLEK